MQKLARYLDERKMTLQDFGDLIGVNGPSVSRYIHGDRIPRVETMARIERATGGAVAAQDWLPTLPTDDDSHTADTSDAA
jgi:predicted transcriptional regulator